MIHDVPTTFYFYLLVVPITGAAAIALIILINEHIVQKIINNDKLTGSSLFLGFLCYLLGAIIWFWLIG